MANGLATDRQVRDYGGRREPSQSTGPRRRSSAPGLLPVTQTGGHPRHASSGRGGSDSRELLGPGGPDPSGLADTGWLGSGRPVRFPRARRRGGRQRPARHPSDRWGPACRLRVPREGRACLLAFPRVACPQTGGPGSWHILAGRGLLPTRLLPSFYAASSSVC